MFICIWFEQYFFWIQHVYLEVRNWHSPHRKICSWSCSLYELVVQSFRTSLMSLVIFSLVVWDISRCRQNSFQVQLFVVPVYVDLRFNQSVGIGCIGSSEVHIEINAEGSGQAPDS